MPPATLTGERLWQKAVETLDPASKANLDLVKTAKRDVLKHALDKAEEKHRLSLHKRWKIKSPTGEVVIVRDVLEKIIAWIKRFRDIGDIAVQYSPTYASLPWAAVRFLLQAAINDTEEITTMLTNLEYMTRLIARFREFEVLYLNDYTRSKDQLEDALVILYAAMLAFLAKAVAFFKQSTAKRIAKAPFKALDDEVNEEIRRKEDEVLKLAELVHAERLLSIETQVTRLSAMADESRKSIDEAKYAEMLAWLSSVPYSSHHRDHSETRIPGTGEWLLHHSQYKIWSSSSTSSILLVHGIPGCGKTSVSSAVIDHFITPLVGGQVPAPTAYFYCSSSESEQERYSAEGVVRCLARQLTMYSSSGLSVHSAVSTAYEQKAAAAKAQGFRISRPRTSECIDIILELLQTDPANIVIDAIDELGDPEAILDALKEIARRSSNVLKILLTSRDDSRVFALLPHAIAIRITPGDNSGDIEKFATQAVTKSIMDAKLLLGHVNPDLKQLLVDALVSGAGEMFLWVKLQLSRLCLYKSEDDIRRALLSLPHATIDELYQATYERVLKAGDVAQEVAIRTFAWLLYVCDPLSPDVFLSAISSPYKWKQPELVNIIDICQNFIHLDTTLNVLRFSHHSVQEFLRAKPLFAPLCAQQILALSCISVCCEGPQEDVIMLEPTRRVYDYAALYWGHHCSAIETPGQSNPLQTHIEEFLFDDDDPGVFATIWLDTIKATKDALPHDHPQRIRLDAVVSDNASPLFPICIFGMTGLLEHRQWPQNFDWDQRNGSGQSALYLASYFGHKEVVSHLISRGVDINLVGGQHGTALHCAAFRGHSALAKVLLHNGADPHFGTSFETVIHAACRGDNEVTALELFECGFNIENSGTFESILRAAAEAGFARLLETLHKHKLSNVVTLSGRNLAYAKAITGGKVGALKCLLGKNNAIESLKSDALALSAFHGHEQMVRYLVDQGFSVETVGHLGTPLRCSCLNGHLLVTRFLLDCGADVNSKHDLGGALHAAAMRGHTHIVKLLLDYGADISATGGSFGNAIQAASYHGHDNTVKLLLEQGADVYTAADARAAIQAAAEGGSYHVLKLFIEHNPGSVLPLRSMRKPGSAREKHAYVPQRNRVGGWFSSSFEPIDDSHSLLAESKPPEPVKMNSLLLGSKPPEPSSSHDTSLFDNSSDFHHRMSISSAYLRPRKRRRRESVVVEEPSSPTYSTVTPLAISQPSTSRNRSQKGCVRCHRFEIKCDSGQPCTQCRAAGVECDYGEEHDSRLHGFDLPDLSLATGSSAKNSMKHTVELWSPEPMDSSALLYTGPEATDTLKHPFVIAAANGHLAIIDLLLDHKHRFEVSEQIVQRALVASAANRRTEVVARLLDLGFHSTDHLIEAALEAARESNFATLELLLKDVPPATFAKTMSLEFQQSDCSTVLNILQYYLQNDGSKRRNRYHRGLLNRTIKIAAEKDFIEVLELISKTGHRLDVATFDNAFRQACKHGNSLAAALLYKWSDHAITPDQLLLYTKEAFLGRHVKLFFFLIEMNEKHRVLVSDSKLALLAAGNGHLDVLKRTLNGKATTDDRVIHQALNIAASNGHYDVCNHLLTEGLNPNVRVNQVNLRLLESTLFKELFGAELERDVYSESDTLEYGGSQSSTPLESCIDGFKKLYLSRTALRQGSEDDRSKIIELLIRNGASPPKTLSDTTLLSAIENCPREIVVLLLENGANFSSITPRYLALHSAITNKQNALEVLQLLVEIGFAAILTNGELQDLLRIASREMIGRGSSQEDIQKLFTGGHGAVFELLLETTSCTDIDLDIDADIIELAAAAGSQKLFSLLIERNIEIHITGGIHGSSLVVACFCGHLGVVKMLVAQGAKLDTVAQNSETALAVALKGGHRDIVEFLILNGADVKIAEFAHKSSYPSPWNVQIFGTAIPAYAQSLLSIACGISDMELSTIDSLIAAGASLCPVSMKGSTWQEESPMLVAIQNRRLDIVQLLLDRGYNIADDIARDPRVLDHAVSRGSVMTCRTILERLPNMPSPDLLRALTLAVKENRIEMAEVLLDYGAKICDLNTQGQLLREICSKGYKEILELILDHWWQQNELELIYFDLLQHPEHLVYECLMTLLEYVRCPKDLFVRACICGHDEIVQVGLDHGLDPYDEDSEGRPALHFAAASGRTSTVKLLISKVSDVSFDHNIYGSALRTTLEGRLKFSPTLGYLKALRYDHLLDLVNEDPWRVLKRAAQENNRKVSKPGKEDLEDILSLLMNGGARDYGASGHFGTALHIAAFLGLRSVFDTLIDRGADLYSRGGIFDTVLWAASRGGHRGIVEQIGQLDTTFFFRKD